MDLFGNPSTDAATPATAPASRPVPPTAPKKPRTPQPETRPAVVRIGSGVPRGRVVRPRRLGRRRNTKLLAVNVGLVAVIISALLGVEGWRADQTLKVKAVAVTVNQTPLGGCHVDADITGTVTTEGAAGDLTYQWRRNDGTTTDPVTIGVHDPGKPTVVHLRWTFTGMGEQSVSIALKVLAPQEKQAVYSFVYRCM
jgi:hypothetical protein